jgi:dipeptide/tripeptide permease
MKIECQPGFRGHPVPLATLSFAEMCERFNDFG